MNSGNGTGEERAATPEGIARSAGDQTRWAAIDPPREGAWAEDSSEAWFPFDGMTRDDARRAYLDLAGDDGWVGWTDVSVIRGWVRFDPDAYDWSGTCNGLWFDCARTDEFAVPVWHVLHISRTPRFASATAACLSGRPPNDGAA